jgi:Uma2 family endonuclease
MLVLARFPGQNGRTVDVSTVVGVRVELVTEETSVRMSYDDWLALESPRSEWVDGVAILMPPQTPEHFDGVHLLVTSLRAALPGLFVYGEVGVNLAHNRSRVPDVAVWRDRPARAAVDEVPLLAVEVVSADSVTRDLVEKSAEYAQAGIAHYWVLDPRSRTFEAFRNDDGTWTSVAVLGADTPLGTLVVEGHDVPLDLTALFRD